MKDWPQQAAVSTKVVDFFTATPRGTPKIALKGLHLCTTSTDMWVADESPGRTSAFNISSPDRWHRPTLRSTKGGVKAR